MAFKAAFLFPHQALAKRFRGKLLAGLARAGLPSPATPAKWVVDVKPVGRGDTALRYLSRYLYRGVVREEDILRCEDGQVTFHYREAKTQSWQTRTLSGADFLWLLLQHGLPKGLRRTRNPGFLHPNKKRLIALLQVLLRFVPPIPITTGKAALTM